MSIHECAARPNADGCEPRDEGRSTYYEAEERGKAGAALGSSPEGRGFSGGLLWLSAREGEPPFASPRFAHPIPKSSPSQSRILMQRLPRSTGGPPMKSGMQRPRRGWP